MKENEDMCSSIEDCGGQSCKIAYPSVSRKIGKWKFRANLRSQNLKKNGNFGNFIKISKLKKNGNLEIFLKISTFLLYIKILYNTLKISKLKTKILIF